MGQNFYQDTIKKIYSALINTGLAIPFNPSTLSAIEDRSMESESWERLIKNCSELPELVCSNGIRLSSKSSNEVSIIEGNKGLGGSGGGDDFSWVGGSGGMSTSF